MDKTSNRIFYIYLSLLVSYVVATYIDHKPLIFSTLFLLLFNVGLLIGYIIGKAVGKS